ncbi:hypothetical protein MGN70_002236 [Eutypa lata]|nr:hypothetical protein MGN70_002236 [Eutypa lata]
MKGGRQYYAKNAHKSVPPAKAVPNHANSRTDWVELSDVINIPEHTNAPELLEPAYLHDLGWALDSQNTTASFGRIVLTADSISLHDGLDIKDQERPLLRAVTKPLGRTMLEKHYFGGTGVL